MTTPTEIEQTPVPAPALVRRWLPVAAAALLWWLLYSRNRPFWDWAIFDIASWGVMSTPALVIDDEVVVSGRIPSPEKVKELLASH